MQPHSRPWARKDGYWGYPMAKIVRHLIKSPTKWAPHQWVFINLHQRQWKDMKRHYRGSPPSHLVGEFCFEMAVTKNPRLLHCELCGIMLNLKSPSGNGPRCPSCQLWVLWGNNKWKVKMKLDHSRQLFFKKIELSDMWPHLYTTVAKYIVQLPKAIE